MESCRLCGKDDATTDIFSVKEGSQHSLGALAMLFAQITIHPKDGLPETICDQCSRQLLTCFKFKIQCETYDKYFRNLISSKIKNPTSEKTEIIKLEYDDDEESKTKVKVVNTNFVESLAPFSDADDQNSMEDELFDTMKHSSSPEETDKNIDVENLLEKYEPGTFKEEKKSNTIHKARKNCIVNIQNDNVKHKSLSDDNLSNQGSELSKQVVKRISDTSNTEKTISNLKCKCCSKKFSSKSKLRKHQLIVGKSLKKNIVSPNLELIEWLKHNSKKSGNHPDAYDDLQPEKPTKKFMCDICGNLFKNFQIMFQHQQTHSDVKLFSCSVCKKKFSRSSHVASHMRIHNNIKPYICETCGRSFVKSSDLTRHKRIHSDAKDYSCPLCSRRFKRSTDVTSHLRSHTGDRPYTCKCGKAYTSHSSLRKHRKLNCFGKLNVSSTSEINSKTEEKL